MSLVENSECGCSWLQKGSTTLSHKKTAILNQTLFLVWWLYLFGGQDFPLSVLSLMLATAEFQRTEFFSASTYHKEILTNFSQCAKSFSAGVNN